MNRESDIKARLFRDMTSTFSQHGILPNPMLVDALVEDAMHQVLHLLVASEQDDEHPLIAWARGMVDERR